MANTSFDAVEASARQLLDGRIEAVRELARARDAVRRVEEQLAEAQRADGRAYAAAMRAGWSADELKDLGFGSPQRQAPGRPPGRRRGTRPSPGRGVAPSVPGAGGNEALSPRVDVPGASGEPGEHDQA